MATTEIVHDIPRELTAARSRTATDASLPPTVCQLPGATPWWHGRDV